MRFIEACRFLTRVETLSTMITSSILLMNKAACANEEEQASCCL
jgi:hypothetical protein